MVLKLRITPSATSNTIVIGLAIDKTKGTQGFS